MISHYLTTALRHFRRHKLTTAMNVVCLAGGLLCFTAVIGIVNYLSASDRFHRNAANTWVVTTRLERAGGDLILPVTPQSSFAVAKHLRATLPDSVTVARASTFGEQTSLAAGAERRAVRASYADAAFTRIFDLRFVAGDPARALVEPRSAVLTVDLARQLFGSTDVVGRTLLVNGRDNVRVTGVIEAPRQPSHMSATDTRASLNFQALISMDLHEAAIARQETPEIAAVRLNRPYSFMWYHTYVLLPEAVPVATLDRALAQIARDHVVDGDIKVTLTRRHVSEIRMVRLDALLSYSSTGLSVATLLLILGFLIVVVAALNYANLATAQATTRFKESALRRVVGAGRGELMAQYLFEALLLTSVALVLMLVGAATLWLTTSGPIATAVEILLFGASSIGYWALL